MDTLPPEVLQWLQEEVVKEDFVQKCSFMWGCKTFVFEPVNSDKTLPVSMREFCVFEKYLDTNEHNDTTDIVYLCYYNKKIHQYNIPPS